MEIIRRQVAIARRRLMFQRFFQTTTWALFGFLLVAVIGVTIPKFFELGVSPQLWSWAWIGGSLGTALSVSAIVTYLKRPSLGEVAIEVDRRFELRERLSTTLLLEEEAATTDMGQALVADAQRRAEKLSIGERFRFQLQRWALMPLIPAVALAVLIFIPDATGKSAADAGVDQTALEEAKQVKTVTEQLKKRLQQQRRQAEADGLKEAEALFQKLERQVDDINRREEIDRKEALIALNDIKKQLEEKRNALGSSEAMKKSLEGMKDLEQGPAEELAKAMEKGEFGEAKEKVDELAQKLRDGSLTEEEKKQLAKQVEQMKEQVAKAVQQHEKNKAELKEKIEQAKREGREAEAAKMQEKLDQMQQMDGQMQQMGKMAEKLESAQRAMESGDMQEAAEALEEMAEELGDMQAELDQLEEMEEALDWLAQAKDQMGCKQCQGQGCKQCQGQGQEGQKPGDGMGKGAGQGERPEEESDSKFYDSQVRGKPKQGRTVIAGKAGGENKKGVTRQSVQDAVLDAITDESDPLEDQVLPRNEREHAEEYFNKLREGK